MLLHIEALISDSLSQFPSNQFNPRILSTRNNPYEVKLSPRIQVLSLLQLKLVLSTSNISTDADGKIQATAPLASAHTPTLVWHDKSASFRLRCPRQACLRCLTFCTFNRAVKEHIDHNAFHYFPSSVHLGGHRGGERISSSGQVYPCSY